MLSQTWGGLLLAWTPAKELLVPALAKTDAPPVLAIPPIGVGITRDFYRPLARRWKDEQHAPSELHAPDLLGNGNSPQKTRTFYTPEIYAQQLLDYSKEHLQKPPVLLVQGGLLPVALEMWRMGGAESISGFCFASPPPLRFISQQAENEPGVRSRFRGQAGRSPGRGHPAAHQ